MDRYWHRSVMKWNCHSGLDTNIPVTDWPHEDGRKFVHSIHGVRAISLPKRRHRDQRRARLEIDIMRVSICATNERPDIRTRLQDCLDKSRDSRDVRGLLGSRITDEEHEPTFVVHMILEDGEDGFCDLMIEVVRAIFRDFGVEDEHGYRLADFTHEQKTWVWLDRGWIKWERWLRIRHGLPLHGTEDVWEQASGREEKLEYLEMQ